MITLGTGDCSITKGQHRKALFEGGIVQFSFVSSPRSGWTIEECSFSPANESIATGHSRVDNYMSFDVDEFARLARWTGHQRYLAIRTPLLYDMKNMTAVAVETRLDQRNSLGAVKT